MPGGSNPGGTYPEPSDFNYSPASSLPPTPAPRRDTATTVDSYDLEGQQPSRAGQNRAWLTPAMRTVGAVAPEVVAAIGKGVQAGGYDKTGKFITASGAVVRGAIDGVSAYQSGEVNKYLTSAGAVVGAVAQYPFNPDAQMGLEAVGLISSTTGRAVAAFQQPPTEPFHTNYPLNTQIASYANASPASMSPATETSIGGSSGPEFVAPPLRRRTTRLDGQTTPAMTNMPLPEQRERARRGAPPLARTTSMQIPPADQNRSKGRKRSS